MGAPRSRLRHSHTLLGAAAPARDRTLRIEVDDGLGSGVANRCQVPQCEARSFSPPPVTNAREADDNGHRHAYRERKGDARRTVDDQRNRPETCKYHDNARQRAPRKAARAAMSRASAVRSSGGANGDAMKGRTVAAASATNAVAMSHGWAAKRLLGMTEV